MIVIVHDGLVILKVLSDGCALDVTRYNKKNIAKGMQLVASDFPEAILVWCHTRFESFVNYNDIEGFFHRDLIMLSYSLSEDFGKRIGYIEQSPFIKIKRYVTYTTWQMSSDVGAIKASVLQLVNSKITLDDDFEYYLNSISYSAMPFGLFCYSEPRLLSDNCTLFYKKTNYFTAFKFVKQHLKSFWVYILFLNIILFERKFPLWSLLKAVFFENRIHFDVDFNSISLASTKEVVQDFSVDVVIPTFGRKVNLYDVLCDLKKQTILPKKIIIVEQNPIENSTSELNFLESQSWPFEIKHVFTHQIGVCNARNLALKETSNEWVFLCDDDGRFDDNLLEGTLAVIKKYAAKVLVNAYTQPNEIISNHEVHQTSMFGSGCSFVRRDCLQDVNFSSWFEFGYGEDKDFGQQLRNKGLDILFYCQPLMLHLKAPFGGFRTKIVHPWSAEKLQPKPSPTVAIYSILHYTREQLLGYKLFLFIKSFRISEHYNVFRYYVNFKKQWASSMRWASIVMKEKQK